MAAVLAGCCAGGRAYGYRRVLRLDARGEPVRGLLAIDAAEAAVVRRIFAEFAAGRSAIQIATRLNGDGVPFPRGGQWNASTIRGDPAELVGILHNPLYRGRLVWGRRQWRKNPDSERRERRYRLRDRSEWVEVAMPDLRIVDDALFAAAEAEIGRRQRPAATVSLRQQNRIKHLMSGLIHCGLCGSNYTISGKDYYRCAGQKERNTVAVRKAPLETARLAVLQHGLLTEEHARLFAEEFTRELARLADGDTRHATAAQARLREVEAELGQLYQNLLAGLASPAVRAMITAPEAEKLRLEQQVGPNHKIKPAATLLPHPALLEHFSAKVASLRASLDDEAVRTKTAGILTTLIESVTIYPHGEHGPEAEVVAKMSDLVAYATNDNAAPKDGASSSTAVVAGTGFEPVTFRL